MSSHIYRWKRFWCPRTGSINLSDDGYLYNPESEFGSIYNPDVKPFDSIASAPCIVLLGESGMGKTYAMQTERNAIDPKIREEGGQALWMDLRAYGSEDRLVRELFESTTFVNWANDKHKLHLFLDSLDECLLRIDTLSALLLDKFRKYPVGQLYLRIACRTAEWPAYLESGLRELWGEEAVGVFELAPLRRVDVIEAAKANNLSPDEFLSEISQREVVPFAIKPVTLDFLIREYSRHGQLPSTKAELYLRGCQLLCEETSESRRNAGYTGDLTAEQRIAVASRIAAATVFTNKYAVWTNVDRGDVPDEDIKIQELCGNECSGDEQFQVNQTAIKETLATGLFSSRGLNRIGWAHQTYAEFLAARYLAQHKMTPVQMMSLIVHSGDPEGRIIPQLRESTAWLAEMVPDVFREVMRADPGVLLRTDIAAADVENRIALIKVLLKSFEEERLLDLDQNIRLHYHKLSHPNLAEKLRPYICDTTEGIFVRRAAIDIAEACKLQALQNDLVKIALDSCQPLQIRVFAAHAVCCIGDDTTKAKMKPLAAGEAGDDPDDELKGYGLIAVWPAHMTAEELFAVLTPPKRPTYFGGYFAFLSSKLVQGLTSSALPIALKWAEGQGSVDKLPETFEKVIDNIVLQAWELIESPGVLEALARTFLTILKHDRGTELIKRALGDDNNKRRLIIEKMVLLLSDPGESFFWLGHSGTSLIMSNDLLWLIERFQTAESKEIQLLWTKLIKRTFDWHEKDHFDAIFLASKNDPILADEFAWLLKPVELNSRRAQEMRENYLREQELLKSNTDRPLLEPPPIERVVRLLEECETGNIAAWWRLNMEMTLEPDSTYYGDEGESDLRVLPGWKAVDAETRVRIMAAARRYILEQDPDTQRWLGTDTWYRPALAGYRALLLLMREDPDFLSAISPCIWKRWAPIIIAFIPSRNAEHEPQSELVKLAYKHAPEEILDTLVIIIDKENEQFNSIHVIGKVKYCWDPRLATVLLNKVKDKALKPECMGLLLGELLDHGNSEARTFAESLVHLPLPSASEERTRGIVAACKLMTHAGDAGWSVIWPVILEDADLGKEIVPIVARQEIMVAGQRGHPYETNIRQRLTVDQLADLYIWLARQYPQDQDPDHQGVFTMGPRDFVVNWRDSILSHLIACGTNEACVAIQDIAQKLPELEELRYGLMKARDITRRRTWRPPQPSDVFKIANNHEMRLVQSGHQLLDVLIESLKRLEKKLHGETPAVKFLWDKANRNSCKPKDEDSFSDYVKIHLDEDLRQGGVIVNREVQIHRDQRTDIHVDAIIRDPNQRVCDKVTVIIEVKGCWNCKLNQAMETQLADHYLKDNFCQHGLYLVGWFNCDQWDEKDYRKKKAPRISRNEAQKQFNVQASDLLQRGMEIKALVINTALQ